MVDEQVRGEQRKRRKGFFFKLAIFFFMLFCFITNVNQQIRYNEMCKAEYELQQEILEKKQRAAYLQAQIDRPFDDEYVKDLARSMLGYHMPEEILYYNDLIK